MSTAENSAEKKIVDAAIECIERFGIQNVTTRKIAEAADVNIAAINYYFRSKERVLDEAMATTIENAFEDWEEYFSGDAPDLEEGLRLVVSTLIFGAERYPNVSRAHLYKPFMGEFDTPFVRRYNSFLTLLTTHIEKRLSDVASEEVKLRIASFLSAATFPAIFPGFFKEFMANSFTEPAVFDRYFHLLTSSLLRGSNDG